MLAADPTEARVAAADPGTILMFNRFSVRSVCAAVGITLTASAAMAASVTTRAGLGGDDYIDWGQLPVGVYSQSIEVSSFAGLTAEVSNPGGLRRADQTGPSGCLGTYPANFAPCDATIFGDLQRNRPNAVTIDFSSPVSGGGSQFASTVYTGPITAQLKAFDSAGVLLESYTLEGITTSAADNSAPFLGIVRAQADIARLEFSALPYLAGGEVWEAVGINRVELLVAAPIPEPAAALLWLLGLPLAALAAQRGRQRRA
jgi:hypothetical protein